MNNKAKRKKKKKKLSYLQFFEKENLLTLVKQGMKVKRNNNKKRK